MNAQVEVNPDPHQLLALVKALYPYAEMFLEAAPHVPLISRFLEALTTEQEGLCQTFKAVEHLPRQQRADVYKGLAGVLAGRYSNGEHVAAWGVILGGIPELCGSAPQARINGSPVVEAKAAPVVSKQRPLRPLSRLTAEQIEARIFAINTCAELMAALSASQPQLVRQLGNIGVRINVKRLSGIRTGRMARQLKQGQTDGACGMGLLTELRAGLELLIDQHAANEPSAPTPNREVSA